MNGNRLACKTNRQIIKGCLNNIATKSNNVIHFLTLLGLGLIKINDVSTNFKNPRPSLILNN